MIASPRIGFDSGRRYLHISQKFSNFAPESEISYEEISLFLLCNGTRVARMGAGGFSPPAGPKDRLLRGQRVIASDDHKPKTDDGRWQLIFAGRRNAANRGLRPPAPCALSRVRRRALRVRRNELKKRGRHRDAPASVSKNIVRYYIINVIEYAGIGWLRQSLTLWRAGRRKKRMVRRRAVAAPAARAIS